MRICYHLIINNPNSAAVFPPSLQTYKDNLYNVVTTTTEYFEDSTQIIQFFNSYEALTSYVNANKMTTEQEATFEEWKTANGISISYEIFELADTTIPKVFP